MNWEAVGAITGLIGIGLVVVSLIYVGVQINQNNKTAKAASRQLLIDTFGAMSWDLASKPDLLILIADGLTDWEGLSNLDKTIFDNLMAKYLWNLHRGILQVEDGILDAETFDLIGDQMLQCVVAPGGKDWYEHTSYASPKVRQYLAMRVEESDKVPNVLEVNPHWLSLAGESR